MTLEFSFDISANDFMTHFYEKAKALPKNLTLQTGVEVKTKFTESFSYDWWNFLDNSFLLATGISDYLAHSGYQPTIHALLNKHGETRMYVVECEGVYWDVVGSFKSVNDLVNRPYNKYVSQMVEVGDNGKLFEESNEHLYGVLVEFDDEKWFVLDEVSGGYKDHNGNEMHYSEAFDLFLLCIGQYYFSQITD